MFKNEMTRKMPCWSCAKKDKEPNDDACPILQDFLSSLPTGLGRLSEQAISGLTFDCSYFVPKKELKEE